MNEVRDTKKTVLFLLNGFGIEAPKSFNVYSGSVMPNLDHISHAYPFSSIYTSGNDAGLNKNQIGNFKSNYLTFSTQGKSMSKEDVIQSKIQTGEIRDNKVINEAINYSILNNSKFHLMICLGNKYSENVYKQLQFFCDMCFGKGVKEIHLHLFLGDNTNHNQKTAINCINSLKYHVIGSNSNIKIASVANKKMLTEDTSLEEKRNYYRMVVSGIGEVWSDYVNVIEKKYKNNMSDDNITPFLIRRENVFKDKDSVFFFNYDNNLGKTYLDMVEKNHNYFPMGKLPIGMKVFSLFQIYESNISYSYENELPDNYFLKNIGNNKRVLVLADKERIGYIVNSLNGFRKEFKNNLNVLPIETNGDRFNTITKYLLAYQQQDIYDLIIADYDLFSDNDKQDVATLKRNMSTIDGCLGAVYNKAQEKEHDLIVTSLYGLTSKINLVDREMVQVNFSEKTPIMIMGKGIDREKYQIATGGSIRDLANLLYYQLGYEVKRNIFGLKNAKKNNKKMNLLLIIALIAMIGLAFLYYYVQNN